MFTLITLKVQLKLADVGGGLVAEVEFKVQHGGELVNLLVDW